MAHCTCPTWPVDGNHALACPLSPEKGGPAAPEKSDDARARESGPFKAERTRDGSWRVVNGNLVVCTVSPGWDAQHIADKLNGVRVVQAGTAGVAAIGGDGGLDSKITERFGRVVCGYGMSTGFLETAVEKLRAEGIGLVDLKRPTVSNDDAVMRGLTKALEAQGAVVDLVKLRTDLADWLVYVVPADDVDPAVARLQLPDGTVPGNAREAAEGWCAAYATERERHAYSVKGWSWVQEAFDRGELPGAEWADPAGEAARKAVEYLRKELETAQNRLVAAEVRSGRRFGRYDETWPNWKVETPRTADLNDRAMPAILLTIAADTWQQVHEQFASAVATCAGDQPGSVTSLILPNGWTVNRDGVLHMGNSGLTIDLTMLHMREPDAADTASVTITPFAIDPDEPIEPAPGRDPETVAECMRLVREFIPPTPERRDLVQALTRHIGESGLPDDDGPGSGTASVDLAGVTSLGAAARVQRTYDPRGERSTCEGLEHDGHLTSDGRSSPFAGPVPTFTPEPRATFQEQGPYRAEGTNVLTAGGLMVASCSVRAIGSLAQRRVGNMAEVIAAALNAVDGMTCPYCHDLGHAHDPDCPLRIAEEMANPAPNVTLHVAGGNVPLGTLVAMVTAQVQRNLNRRRHL